MGCSALQQLSISALKELHPHGTKTFPCAVYRMHTPQKGMLVKHHWHEEIEILHFYSGRFCLTVNMEQYTISSECLYFINPGELHSIIFEGQEYSEEAAVVFDSGLLGCTMDDDIQLQIINPLRNRKMILPRCITAEHPAFVPLIRSFEDVIHSFDRHGKNNAFSDYGIVTDDLTSQLYIKSSLLHIIGILTDQQLLIPIEKNLDRRIEGLKIVLSYIKEHYQEKIYLRNLAEQANMNEQYFCRFFKKGIGCSPMTYINDYRIKQSIRLLKETDLSVMDICLECGYHNLGNYLREFRKHTGTTPAQYRKTLST